MTYRPDLPWGGQPSPCGNLALQRQREYYHANWPATPAPVDITFADLADCRECLMCGGCEIHDGCLIDMNHIEWHMQFASPGEPACGDVHTLRGRTTVTACALRAGHGGEWHQERGGAGWKV